MKVKQEAGNLRKIKNNQAYCQKSPAKNTTMGKDAQLAEVQRTTEALQARSSYLKLPLNSLSAFMVQCNLI